MQKLFVCLSIGFCLFLFTIILSPYCFKDLSFSKVLYSKEANLLSAKISKDGQWRFSPTPIIPEAYKTCLISYEDKRFYSHIGIDPMAILRACYNNIKRSSIKFGASTISMQLARMLLKNPKRNITNKLIESILAIGIEFNFSKSEILSWYASLAPFGGNVVGLKAALWRYYQRNEMSLSWAEAALFAVLPNQPSSIRLDRNRNNLLKKRNKLLTKIYESGSIDQTIYELALLEEIPGKVFPIPQISNLLLDFLVTAFPNKNTFNSTIVADLQSRFSVISNKYNRTFRQNEIHNLAVLLVSNKTGEVLSYLANSTDTSKLVRNGKVNNIHALRSSGSVLKPLLYAASLDRGIISPTQLMTDIPTLISGFRPENYSRTYQGVVPIDVCIQQSLNVPAVKLLQKYGVQSFYDKLKSLGFSSLFRPSSDYGLSLILGGAEIRLCDLAYVYASLANSLLERNNTPKSTNQELKLHLLIPEEKVILNRLQSTRNANLINTNLSAGAISTMLITMQNAKLPEEFNTRLSDFRKNNISWKTGTSFGFKDAWCVGICNKFTMVVWVGNSSGLGRPGLIGLHTAAPLLFELFDVLNCKTEWPIPFGEMHPLVICKQSGYLPSVECNILDTLWYTSSSNNLNVCSFHKTLYVDETEDFRVFKECEINGHLKNYFVLPPIIEYYYKPNHPSYQAIPEVRLDCKMFQDNTSSKIEFIYPEKGNEVFIPINLTGESSKLILKATHKEEHNSIHWFLDGRLLGSTMQNPHEWAISPEAGEHQIYIMDETGESTSVRIICYKR